MWFPDPFCLKSTYSFQNHLSDGNQMSGSLLIDRLCSQEVHTLVGKDMYLKTNCCIVRLRTRGRTQLCPPGGKDPAVPQ